MDRDAAKAELLHPERKRVRAALHARNNSFQETVLEELRELERLYEELAERMSADAARKAVFEGAAASHVVRQYSSPRDLRARAGYAESCLRLADCLQEALVGAEAERGELSECRRALEEQLRTLLREQSALEDRKRAAQMLERAHQELGELSEMEERFCVRIRG